MSKRILILDDDVHFNSLLTDVYRQARYDVASVFHPRDALDYCTSESFDAIVSDHRMPDLTSLEFVEKVKSVRPEIPVIVVSGGLTDHEIRALIKTGVGGVFLKPLNIFSLLKHTDRLLEAPEQNGGGPRSTSNIWGQLGFSQPLPFPFQSLPCRAEASAEFARQLYELRDFSPSLQLIGETGSDFEGIASDLVTSWSDYRDRAVLLTSEELEGTDFISRGEQLAKGKDRITLVITDAADLDQVALSSLLKRLHGEADAVGQSVPWRAIYCLHDEIDALYEAGKIDENLYMNLGTLEIRIPPLRKVRKDIPLLAESILHRTGPPQGTLRISPKAAEYLERRDWPGNYAQLKELIMGASEAADGPEIGVDDIRAAIDRDIRAENPEVAHRRFKAVLEAHRNEYVRSMSDLWKGDRRELIESLGISREMAESIGV